MTAHQHHGLKLADLLPDWRACQQAALLPAGWRVGALDDLVVSGVQLDSRKVSAGDLFIAMPGFDKNQPVDGRRFIAEAAAAGAVAVVAEAEGWEAFAKTAYAVPVIFMASLSRCVSGIAGAFYGQPSEQLKVIGVTGTNGKTTCSHLLAQLFNRLDIKSAVVGTMGYGVPDSAAGLTDIGLTTPDAVTSQAILARLLDGGVSNVVMEVSSHSLEQGRLEGVRIRGGIFTNLSRDHLDYHGTMDAYGAAKERLFQGPGLEFAVINLDDPAGREMLGKMRAGVACYSYSLNNDSAALQAKNIRYTPEGLDAEVVTPWGEATLCTGLIGEFNLSNLLAVVGAACASGLPFERVIDTVGALQPVAGRLEVIKRNQGPRVVIDYAHTPDALEQTLSALHTFSSQLPVMGELWCVFGCGGDRDIGKRAEMGAVAARLADRVVITSDNPRNELPSVIMEAIAQGAGAGAHCIEDRAEAIQFAIANAAVEDTVLIAGKGHERYQITGERRLPFSDAAQARLALRSRSDDSE